MKELEDLIQAYEQSYIWHNDWPSGDSDRCSFCRNEISDGEPRVFFKETHYEWYYFMYHIPCFLDACKRMIKKYIDRYMQLKQ